MEEERRKFLEKFALLSSASLVLGGCSPNVVYGPPPSEENETTEGLDEDALVVYGPPPTIKKSLIFYQEAEGELLPLNQKDTLPLMPLIVIQFPTKMEETSQNSVNLMDAEEEALTVIKRWKSEAVLEIQPREGEMHYDTPYTVVIDQGIQDREGEVLEEEEYALVATFKTMKR